MVVLQAGALRMWMHKEVGLFMDENRDALKMWEETNLVPLAFIPPFLIYGDIVVSPISTKEVLGNRHVAFTIKKDESVFILEFSTSVTMQY